MSGKGRRRLTREENELWRRVAGTTNPLKKQPAALPVREPKLATPQAAREPVPEFQIGSKAATALPAHDLAPSLANSVADGPLRMDRKTFQKMRRGKALPEGRIDLHGLTVADAHGALTGFILSSQAAGKRLVLVITGKGKRPGEDGPIPTRVGVLRHQVPHWLQLPPLKSAVLQVSEAHRRHGGSGAFYVYLRRR